MRPTARMPKLTRRSRILILIALGVMVLLLAGPRLIDAYVDWLWFGELGYRSVFTTVLVTRIVVFLVAGVLVGGITHKMVAARAAGATVFLVPAKNCYEASSDQQTGLRLVKVETLSQAVDALHAMTSGGQLPSC